LVGYIKDGLLRFLEKKSLRVYLQLFLIALNAWPEISVQLKPGLVSGTETKVSCFPVLRAIEIYTLENKPRSSQIILKYFKFPTNLV
jgi:hypothetical protein